MGVIVSLSLMSFECPVGFTLAATVCGFANASLNRCLETNRANCVH
jgi:hypothetical protein